MAAPFFTAAQCEAQLTAWMAASEALAQGKAVTMPGTSGGRSWASANADEIERMIKLWTDRRAQAIRGAVRPRMRLVDPL